MQKALRSLENVRQQCADLHDQLAAAPLPDVPPPIRIVDNSFTRQRLQQTEREQALRILERARWASIHIKDGIAEIEQRTAQEIKSRTLGKRFMPF